MNAVSSFFSGIIIIISALIVIKNISAVCVADKNLK